MDSDGVVMSASKALFLYQCNLKIVCFVSVNAFGTAKKAFNFLFLVGREEEGVFLYLYVILK